MSEPSTFRENVERLSERTAVELFGFGLGREKEESFRLPIIRKRLSG